MAIPESPPNSKSLRVVTSFDDWHRHRFPTLAAWMVAEHLTEMEGWSERDAARYDVRWRDRMKPRPRVRNQLCMFLAIPGAKGG